MGRGISFAGDYAIDYELYFWWGWNSGMGSDNFITWTGSDWDYKGLAKPSKLALIAWVAGEGGSSAVSSIPWSSAMESLDAPFADESNRNEWVDTDYFTNLAEVYIVPKTIDGDLSDWESYEVVGVSNLDGPDGADLNKLYVSYDEQYLYVAITTNNTASWGVVYGFGLDVKEGGYTGDTDAWDRKIGFSRGVDYEIYFWYDGGNDVI
ncbi:MAG: hypothetical protein PWQ92_1391, partial [Thermococcaceae archaeon]|nr:hypothetical protein [Thermococcaceae archaeon]